MKWAGGKFRLPFYAFAFLLSFLFCTQVFAAIDNTATASGTYAVTGAPVTSAPSSVAVPVVPPTNTLSVVKTPSQTVDVPAGTVITYTYTVTNTSNGPLNTITLADTHNGIAGALTPAFQSFTTNTGSTNSGDTITLFQPGDVAVFTAQYTVVQNDVNTKPAPLTLDNTVVVTFNRGANTFTQSTTAQVDIEDQNNGIILDKQAVLNDGGDGRADPGDVISYTFRVENTGNTTLTDVLITETFSGAGTAPTVLVPVTVTTDSGSAAAQTLNDSTDTNTTDGDWDVLGPGDVITFTASYALVQGDIDSSTGFVTNNATASGRTPTNGTVSSADQTQTPTTGASSMTLVKTGVLNMGTNARADAGDTVSYTMRVTNTGATTLSNVRISDTLLSVGLQQQKFIAAIAALREGADAMSTASLPVAELPTGGGVAQSTPPVRTGLHAKRKLIRVTGNPGIFVPGDVVGIVFDVTNTGEGPLTAVHAEQERGAAYASDIELLAADSKDSFSILFTYELTDADVAAGAVLARAVVRAKSRNDAVDVVLADPVPLTLIGEGESLLTAAITPTSVATLAPGQFTDFTATHTVTSANMTAGVVNNTATALADGPGGPIPGVVDSETVLLPQLPQVAVVKAGTLNLGTNNALNVGDTITYRFTVSNPGNVTLTNVTVSDPLRPGNPLLPGTIASLAPGQSNATTFTFTYAITQADIDQGFVQNTGTVNATGPGNTPVSDTSHPTNPALNAPTVVPLSTTPRIGLLKADGVIADTNNNGLTDLGDTITYTFAVTNTGNVTLDNITLTDPLLGGALPGSIASLAPGQTNNTTFSGTYVLTQLDIDAGEVLNRATVTGTPRDGGPAVTDESDETSLTQNRDTVTTVDPEPRIALIKTVSTIDDTNSNSAVDAGDVINYAFEVRNLGNVTLNNVAISDPLVGPVSGVLNGFTPGAVDTTTFTASYSITGIDVAAGRVTNLATVTGRTPKNVVVTDQSDNSSPDENDPTITAIISDPEIAVLKTVTAITDVNNNSLADAGDSITYAFSVRNTGNVPLSNVTLTDPLVTVAGGPINTLLAGDTDTTTFSAVYVLTAADITRGYVENQATATGAAPDTTVVTDLSDAENYAENDPTRTFLATTPRIALVKTSTSITDANGNGQEDEGDVINYAFTVTNTGNAVLSNVTITDPNAVIVGGPLAVLGISQSDGSTFTGTHVITRADLNNNGVTNQATVTGRTPSNATVSDLSDDASLTENDPTFTPLSGIPAVAVVKKVSRIDDRNGNGITDVGDIINYAFAITNTGSVSLTNVTLTDNNAVIKGTSIARLDPGQTNSSTFTGVHVVTGADAEAGEVVNQAIVRATSLQGVVVSDVSDNASVSENDPTTTPIAKTRPTLSKVAGRSEIRRGERVTYTITAGNLLTGPYTVVDTLPPGFAFAPKTATVNGTAAVPDVNAKTVSFTGLKPDASGKITIKLTLIAGTSLATGEFINRAALFDESLGTQVAKAQAAVTIREEHVFDCGEIIGRVFDDLNGNGYADDGEPGIAGVRVVTVNGLLITSDEHGRFHIACADIPDAAIGSTFILKLDPRTLPDGYVLTTENPRDMRLTRGKVTKLNFGARRSCDVALEIKRNAFETDSAKLKPEWRNGLYKLRDVLKQCPGSLNITYRCGEYAPIADRRLKALQERMMSIWKESGEPYDLIITGSVECGK